MKEKEIRDDSRLDEATLLAPCSTSPNVNPDVSCMESPQHKPKK